MNEKWKKLTAKQELLTVGDIPITVKGLTYKEAGYFMKYQDKKDYEAALNYLLEVTLKKAPEVDNADIPEILDTISAEAGVQITNKVRELSGISAPESKNDDSAN